MKTPEETEKKRLYERTYAQHPRYKLNKNTRTMLRFAIQGRTKNSKYESMLGYSIKEFLDHMEAQFLPGMSFDNYGKWEIDHKTPLNLYEFTCPLCPEYKEAWKLENLRPLWAYHNRKRKKNLKK